MRKIFSKIIILVLLTFCIGQLVQAQDKSASVTKEKTKLLESYGLLSSSSLYLSYLSLTYIEKDIPKAENKENINTIIMSVHKINSMLQRDIEKLKLEVKLSGDDLNYMQSMTEIASMLIDDANLLKKYADTKKAQDRQKYLDHHALLFDKMNKLFYGEKDKNEVNE